LLHSPLMIYSFIFNVFLLLLNVCLRSIISVALYSSGSWINQQFKMSDCCKCSFAHLFCLEAEQKISSRSKLSFAWSSHPATCNLHTCNSKRHSCFLTWLLFERRLFERRLFERRLLERRLHEWRLFERHLLERCLFKRP
jgi:hypothetical protein